MSREDPQLKIRLPEALKAKIERSAEAAGRSMNSEIVARLQATYDETVVTTVEARVMPGAQEKRFEFNADEIADKVVERLEGRKKRNTPTKVVIPNNLDRSPDFRSVYDDFYANIILRGARANASFPGGQEPELKPRGNEPYGPRKSANASKSLPKKPRGNKA
ncbi:Arc family DNA-binding protein [Acidovorax sp. NCPPB 3576]|uniref:Arc family DNA-binding protein n=1 Tax=Acidovorax sp. NCPPB 3576 TaxID=2940488 RepID=UPI00234A9A76|nr:Arc family DNA-binding protein [Acidovorax sp. NCPPB 3576]WCM86683.1 Arc family DNA-binding protein [Acidovorax sp. NCPPB 3576]